MHVKSICNTTFFITLIFAITACFISWELQADTNQYDKVIPIRAALITGDHYFNEDTFFQSFDGHEDIEYTHYPQETGGEIFDNVSDWDYDVFVLYNMSPEISEARQHNFINLLDRGVGLLVLHHGILNYPDWEETEYIYGRRIAAEAPFEFHLDQEYVARIADPNHPITKGMSDFTIVDETYVNYYGNIVTDNIILVYTDHKLADNEIMWARHYSNSRVVCLQQGHDTPAFENENYRRLIAQSIRWTAGRLPENQHGTALVNDTLFRQKNLDWALDAALKYNWGEPRTAFDILQNHARELKAENADTKLFALAIAERLEQNGTRDGVRFMLVMLEYLAEPDTVDSVLPFLVNPDYSELARAICESIATDSAKGILRTALESAEPAQQVGIMHSLGILRDEMSVEILEEQAISHDLKIARAAIQSLGMIASTNALRSLESINVSHSLQEILAHSKLNCADHQLREGNVDVAWKIYKTFYALEWNNTIRSVAYRGLLQAAAISDKPVLLLLQQHLSSANDPLTPIAVANLNLLNRDEEIAVVAEHIVDLDSTGKVQLITALANLGNDIVSDTISELTQDNALSVRLAAITALGKLGEASKLNLIANIALKGSTDSERNAAKQALTQIPGDEMSHAIAKLMTHEEVEFRLLAAETLMIRQANTFFPDLVNRLEIESESQVREKIIEAIGALGNEDVIPVLFDRYGTDASDDEQITISEALKNIANRSKDITLITDIIAQSLDTMNDISKIAAFELLNFLGTVDALLVLTSQISGENKPVRLEAIHALGNWPNANATEHLFDLIPALTIDDEQESALKGFIRLLGLPNNRQIVQTLNYYEFALSNIEDRELLLSVIEKIADIQHTKTLEILLPYTSKQETSQIAAKALLELAKNLGLDHPEEVNKTLLEMIDIIDDDTIKANALETQTSIEEFKSRLITHWTFNEDLEQWVAIYHSNISHEFEDGYMLVDCTGPYPQLQIIVDREINISGPVEFLVRIKSNATTDARLFWATTDNIGYGEDRVVSFSTYGAEGDWYEASATFEIDGVLAHMRFDPARSSDPIFIDHIRLMRKDRSID